MDTKQREVFKWLAETLKDSSLPIFEVNKENIEILHLLMNSHKESFKDADNVLEEYEEKTQNYELHASQLAAALEKLKISENIFKEEDKKSFDYLVNLSLNLGLSTPNSSIINPTIYSLEAERNQFAEALKKEKSKAKNLLMISESLGRDISDLKRIGLHASYTEDQLREELKHENEKSHFCKEKIANYNDDISKLEVKLEFAGFDPSLTYETVSQKMKELNELEKRLENATKALSSYTLPPDMELAQAKVEEARKALEDSLKGFTRKY